MWVSLLSGFATSGLVCGQNDSTRGMGGLGLRQLTIDLAVHHSETSFALTKKATDNNCRSLHRIFELANRLSAGIALYPATGWSVLQRVACIVEQRLKRVTQGSNGDDSGDGDEAYEQAVLKHGCSALITNEAGYYFGQN
jgi:hypothetical protein